MKYNFSEVKIKDIDGKEINNTHKALANAIYLLTENLDLVEIAQKINRGEEVDLEKAEVETIKQIINEPKAGFFAFVKKAYFDYIDSVKEKSKE